MNKAILWDLDGTLLYTLEDIAGASNATLTHFGYPTHSVQAHLDFVGNGAAHQLRSALGFEPPEFPRMLEWYKAYYTSHFNDTSRPYPGIPELTRRLKEQGWRLAVVTNKPHAVAEPLCRAWLPHFDLILGEQPTLPRKPAPDMVRHALSLLETEPEGAVFVGDSRVDVRTAQNAGLPCIAVTWGYDSQQTLLEAGATHLCHRAEEFPQMLEELTHGQ